MNEQAFVERRDEDWRRLTELSDKVDGKGAKALSGRELREFVKLYRRACTDLALVRTKSRNLALVEYLNGLTGRAYGILYRAPRPSVFQAVQSGLATSAQTVRRRWGFILASALIFFGSTFFVGYLTSVNPEVKEVLVDGRTQELFDSWKKATFEERSGSESVMMGALYASNNPRVAIIAAAVGAGTFGFGSVYLLFANGALIGSLGSEMASVGQLPFLITSILPHGVPELSGIMIAGAAGILFGWALINPGRRTRGDALRLVGRDGMVLIVTSVVLMFIAAPIEGFFSFNPAIPQWFKGAFGAVSLLGYLVFWIGYARTEAEPTADEGLRSGG